MKGNSIFGLILPILFISCGKGITERSSAPKTSDQVGIIASCTSKSEAQSIAEEFGIQYRVINEKRKIIEFIGISQKDLAKLRPNSKFRKNKIYDEILISGSFSSQSYGNFPYYGPHSAQYRDQSSGRYFPHLNQVEALSVNNMGEGVTIAIIDTGVYYNHPHLSPNIKTNESDKHGSISDNVDNDGNGFTDDYVGWDFYNGDAYPIDDNGHGTHVAGLAASTYMGIAPKAKILPIKVLGSDGRGDLGTIAAGIMYAIDQGADIINLSLGGSTGSQITAEVQQIISAVQSAKRKSLLVAAAGNGGNDGLGDCNDNLPIYPANIQEENLIAVASVDRYNNLTEYSNFGGATVHIAAPGGDYYTGALNSAGIPNCNGPCTTNDVPYKSSMGTSMATPIVSGLAAIIKSIKPNLLPAEIKMIIMNKGTKLNQLDGLIKSSSVMNVKKAVQNL